MWIGEVVRGLGDGNPSSSVTRISSHDDGQEDERTGAVFPISGSTTHLGVQDPQSFLQIGSAEHGESVTSGTSLCTPVPGNDDGQDQKGNETLQNADQTPKNAGTIFHQVWKDEEG